MRWIVRLGVPLVIASACGCELAVTFESIPEGTAGAGGSTAHGGGGSGTTSATAGGAGGRGGAGATGGKMTTTTPMCSTGCDDQRPCTDDSCVDDVCSHTPNEGTIPPQNSPT